MLTSGGTNEEDVMRYKKSVLSLFDKILQVMMVSKTTLGGNFPWAQCKLTSQQIQEAYYPASYYNSSPYGNFGVEMHYPVSQEVFANQFEYALPQVVVKSPLAFTKESMAYDSSLLKGETQDVLEWEGLTKNNLSDAYKNQEKKWASSSTCKSTSNSHQENILNTSCVNEEIKWEDLMLNLCQAKEQVSAVLKSNIKARLNKLEVQSKIREPLSVRKFDKNRQDLCVNSNAANKNSIYLSSTLPAKWLWFDLLDDKSQEDSNFKVDEGNSFF